MKWNRGEGPGTVSRGGRALFGYLRRARVPGYATADGAGLLT